MAAFSPDGAHLGRIEMDVPSHAERFIKIAAHDYHEVCEVPG